MENHPLLMVLIFLGAAALLGLYLISRYFRRLPRQNLIMMIHGFLAAAGVGTLFFHSAFSPNTEIPYASLFFFIVAIFSGILMAIWDKIMNRQMPQLFPLVHAGAAVTGLALLVMFIIKHQQPL
ncbi:MAG TPA: hypothetical protein VK927_09880 [Adhaeribacter sp.]|nr:hypothetical protein [Adhaeribacter sp.]